MPTFETADHCSIYYETYGFEEQNPTILFLNGTTQTTLNWLPLARDLQKQFRVILYDARGQGQSALGQKKFTLELHVEDLDRLLGHLKIEKTNLVGLSHGAHAACAFAALNRKRTARVVLCSLGAEKDNFTRAVITCWQKTLNSGGVTAMAWAALPLVLGRQYLGAHRRWVEKIVAAIVSRNRKTFLAAQLAAMESYPAPSKFAGRIETRCLILRGAADPLVTSKNAIQLADLCSGRYFEFPETGHSVPAESPEVFKSTLLEFLQDPE